MGLTRNRIQSVFGDHLWAGYANWHLKSDKYGEELRMGLMLETIHEEDEGEFQVVRAIPIAAVGASPLAKAMCKAFEYHPFGLNTIHFTTDGWAYAPTYIIRVDEDVQTWVALSDGYKPYKENDQKILVGPEKLFGMREGWTQAYSLDKKGHSKAPKTRRDKFGADQVLSGGKCTFRALRALESKKRPKLELSFPLVQLAKRLGTDRIIGYPEKEIKKYSSMTPRFPYTLTSAVGLLDKDSELVGIVAARYIPDECEVEDGV